MSEWADITRSNTTTKANSSKFLDVVPVKPYEPDGTGGVDFQIKFSTINPWSFSSNDPIVFYDGPRNDPAY